MNGPASEEEIPSLSKLTGDLGPGILDWVRSLARTPATRRYRLALQEILLQILDHSSLRTTVSRVLGLRADAGVPLHPC